MKTWAECSGCKKTSRSPPESLVPANWKFAVPKRMSNEIATASSVRLVYACLNRLKPWQDAVGRLRVRNDNGCPSEDSLRLSCKRWRCSQQRDVSYPAQVVTLTSTVLGSHLIDFCAESVQVLTHKRGRHDIEPSRRTAKKVGTEQAFL